MKKMMILLVVALVSLASCKKEEIAPVVQEPTFEDNFHDAWRIVEFEFGGGWLPLPAGISDTILICDGYIAVEASPTDPVSTYEVLSGDQYGGSVVINGDTMSVDFVGANEMLLDSPVSAKTRLERLP